MGRRRRGWELGREDKGKMKERRREGKEQRIIII